MNCIGLTQRSRRPRRAIGHCIGKVILAVLVWMAAPAHATAANAIVPVWRNVTPADTPTYTQDSSMTFDSARNRAVLLHADSGVFSLRSWDGSAWTGRVLAGATPGPTMRIAPIAYDTAFDRIVMFGGFDGGRRNDTWAWDGTSANWSDLAPQQKPSTRNGHAMVYDSARRRMVMTGGIFCFVPAVGPCTGTWEFDGTNWSQVATSGAEYTPARWRHAMAYDAARGVVVLFGGASVDYSQAYDDTWEFDGTAWTRRTSANGQGPSGRHSHTMAYDATRQKVVLYGGSGVATDAAHWEWDGQTWTRVTQPAVNPGQRQRHAMTYDSARQRLVLTGNLGGWGNSPNEVWELAYEPGVTTTTLSGNPTASAYGQSVVFTATVTPVAPATAVPTGTVAFFAGGNAIAGCSARTLDNAGVATCATAALAVGTQSITAQYGGDAAYPPAQPASNTLSHQVSALVTSIGIGLTPGSTQFGQVMTLAATVAIGGDADHPAIAGTVAFYADDVLVPGCGGLPVHPSGVQCDTTSLAAGTHGLRSVFTPGNGNVLPSSSSAVIASVSKGSTALALTLPAQPVLLGQSVSIGASVSVIAPAAGAPGGTIAISDGSGASCSIAWPQQTACALTPASAGTRQLSAEFTPDAASGANFHASTASGELIVSRIPQAALSLIANPAELIPGMTSQLVASGGSGNGVVTYSVDSGACSVAASVATALGAGQCIVRATKAGDTNYEEATVTATLVVHAVRAPEADAQTVSVAYNTARAIQLSGRDTNPGGPYALTYRIVTQPVHGAISHFDANTGTLTYTPAPGPAATDSFTFTAATVNGTSQAATVTLTVTPPQLALRVEDGRDFTRYGRVVDYVVTLTNTGAAANAVPVTFTLSAGLDADFAHLTCVGADGGARCEADANDPLRYIVTLPPERALTWLVSVPVRSNAAGADVRFTVAAPGADSVTDVNTLVVFRDGFDVPYVDGMPIAPVVDGAQAKALSTISEESVSTAIPSSIVVPARTTMGALPAALLIVRDGGSEVRIEACAIGDAIRVRLIVLDAGDQERASAWSVAAAGAVLTVTGVADAQPAPAFLLDGAQIPLTVW
jgi:hypothetical protein